MRLDAIVADRLGSLLPAPAAVRRARAAHVTQPTGAVQAAPRPADASARGSVSVRVIPAAAPGVAAPAPAQARQAEAPIAPGPAGAPGEAAGFLEIFQRERSVFAFQMPLRTPAGMGQLMYLLEVETTYRVVQPLPPGGLIDVEG
jgi:hypothetical protein